MNGDFFAMMFRMKNIGRWGLMRLIHNENLSEHSLECAFLAHGLAVIGNVCFGKSYDPELIAVKAMYHDAPEIITGDLPTPVKYFDDRTKDAYRSVESVAIDRFISYLPDEMRDYYKSMFSHSEDEHKLIKAADKLCAYIKCLTETELGNREFRIALESTKKAIDGFGCEELDYFMENCIDSFKKSLDELQENHYK